MKANLKGSGACAYPTMPSPLMRGAADRLATGMQEPAGLG